MIFRKYTVPFLKQWFAAGNVFLLTTSVGLTFGWISPFLGNLVRPDPHFEVTKEQTSWIASLTSLSQPIGIIFAYLMVNFWGSKVCAHVCGIFFITAWVILVFATTVQHVFASLSLLGIGIGIVYMIFPMYMAEISDYKIRGALVGFVVHGITIGTVMGNLLGAVLTPSMYGIINFVIILICLISFAFVPSTPHYLIRQKKMKEAEKSIIWYNNDVNSAAEVKKISEFLETSPSLPFLKSLREVIKPTNIKALAIIIMIECLTYLFGGFTLQSYAEVIFIDSKVDLLNPATLVIILSGLTIPVGWLSIIAIDRIGRITMLLISYFLICLALLGLSVIFLLLEKGFDGPTLQVFSVLCALVFRVGLFFGITPVAPTLIGELYAPNVKSVSCFIHNIFTAVCMFISSKTFQFLIDNLTYKYTFLLLAGLMFVIGLCVRMFVPETKGKTLQEIQEILHKDKTSNSQEKQKDVENNTN